MKKTDASARSQNISMDCFHKDTETMQFKDGGKVKSPAWQRKEGKNPSGGLNQKGVDSYKRDNPGSKLKTAVTGKVAKGSKAAKRRKSFCARSAGQAKMHNVNCRKTPNKRICQARRRWKC